METYRPPGPDDEGYEAWIESKAGACPPPNRWAAFTTDELVALFDGHDADSLAYEIELELGRRKMSEP